MHEEFIQMLKDEHEKIRDKMKKLLESPRDTFTREDLFWDLKRSMKKLFKEENTSLNQALVDKPETHMLGLHLEEEQRAMRQLMHDLFELNVDDDRWMARVEVLGHMLEQHFNCEESSYDQIRQVFTEDQMHNIANKFNQAKQRVEEMAWGGKK